jgi:hypothetical protein
MSAAYYATWAPNFHTACALAAFAACVDLVKPQLFAQAADAWRGRRWGTLIGASFLACLLAFISMIAVDGLMLKLRTDTSGGLTHVQSTWDRAESAYKGAVSELASIGKVEPIAKLEAELAGSVPVAVWTRTAKCTDITKTASREACEPALRIMQQIATAQRVATLEQQRDQAKKVLDTTQRPAAADPQVEALSRALKGYGVNETIILLALTWLVGLAVELVSCFGIALLSSGRDEAESAPEPAQYLTPEQQALQWVLSEINRSHGKMTVLNTAIAAKFGVDPATATRWRQKWVEAGVLAEQKDGRVITLKLARR